MVSLVEFLGNVKRLLKKFLYTKEDTRANFDSLFDKDIGYSNGNFYIGGRKIVKLDPLVDTVTVWNSMSGTNYISVEADTGDNIFISHGSYLNTGWSNNGLWTVDFDYKYTSTKYIGLMISNNVFNSNNPFTDAQRNANAITTWEGSFPYGNGNLVWIVSPSSWTKPSQTGWNHLCVEKIDDTCLKIVLNDTYTWIGLLPPLTDWTDLYLGSRENPSSRTTGGSIVYKNIVIRERG